MKYTFYQVNAFTADGKNGNPAGVVLGADALSDEEMQQIAMTAGFSETAFVGTSKQATKRLRFFTPTNKVDLCGHATIATWSLMHEKGLLVPGEYTQETRAGILGVSIMNEGLVFMEQTAAEFYEEIPLQPLTSLLGISEAGFSVALKPQIVSTGLRDLLVPLKDKSTLARVHANLGAITSFSQKHQISGLHAFSLLEHEESIASARNFAPADGIDEEAATGTSNGALLCYLKKQGQLAEQAIYRIEQGESMGRLSYIYGKFTGDIVWIGGSAQTIASNVLSL